MNIRFRKPLIVAALGCVAVPGTVLAGTLGGTSTDSLGLTLTKDQLVKVSQLDDIDFGTLSNMAAAGVTGTDDVCVFSNSGAFELTLTSLNDTGTGNGFAMSNGTSDLAYSVQVGQDAGGLGGFLSGLLGGGTSVAATSGEPITGLESGPDEDCTGANGENLELSVSVAQADFQQVSAGTYTDTVTVFVRPE